MIGLALALQIVAVTGVTERVDTSTYTSPILKRFVMDAAALNHRVPPALGKYTARLESEISIGNQNGAGLEISVGIEQVASELSWNRRGEFEQHVVGYRQQALGIQFASLGFFRNAWAIPSLYGNRLALLFGRDTSRSRTGGGSSDRRTTYAVHPLSDDREKYYRYAGGDTIQELKVGDRTIRIVRVEVVPRGVLPPRSVVFSGEMDLDAERSHIVRLRGAFSETGTETQGPLGGILKATKLEGIAFVELVNSEIEQQFWLPTYQRFEAQATAPIIGDAKAVFRIVSRFRDYEIAGPEAAKIAATDTLQSKPHTLSIATGDTLGRFTDWKENIGAATSATHATDFVDVSPTRRRGEGPPSWSFEGERLTDLIHFNRIEGPFTGAGVTYRGNSANPGFEFRLLGGYAWTEKTVRGRAAFALHRGKWEYALRVGRVLDNTNDFRNAFDSSGTIGAFFGVDRYDYVSRQFALYSVSRELFDADALLGVETGWMRDESTRNSVGWAPVSGNKFLPNRSITPGEYARTQIVFQWHPGTTAEYMRTGWGAQVKYTRGDGTVRFQRLELRANQRFNRGPWTFAGRFDAGTMIGRDFPPQMLFEIGNESGLTGYDYKQFVGTEAALLRGVAMYRLGVLTRPTRITDRIWLPGLSPSLALSVQSAWTAIPGGVPRDVGLAAATKLPPFICTTTNGVTSCDGSTEVTGAPRTSVALGVRIFGGAIGISLARPVDHVAKWRFEVQFGNPF